VSEDELERRLRAALHGEADHVEAAPGDFQRLQQRIATEGGMGRRDGERRGGGWLPWLATAAAVACIAGLGGAWLVGRPDSGTVADAPTAAGVTTAASPTPADRVTESPDVEATAYSTPAATLQVRSLSAVANSTRALPVYWVAPRDTKGYALYREYYTAPRVGAQQAVDAMLTGRPTDRDYSSPWRPATAKVTVRDDVIVVDLASAAFGDSSVSGSLAQAGLQQLVYTATAGAALETGRTGSLPVRVLVDGKPGATVWKSVTLSKPLQRDPLAVADVWVTSPVEGSAHRAGKLTVDVYGTAFEATVLWVVYRIEGGAERQVRDGYLNVGSMGERAAGRFTVTLSAGTYRVRVYAPDMSGGEAPANPEVPADQTGDDKTITVR